MIQLKIRVFGSLQTDELQKTKLPVNNIRFSVAESLLESELRSPAEDDEDEHVI